MFKNFWVVYLKFDTQKLNIFVAVLKVATKHDEGIYI